MGKVSRQDGFLKNLDSYSAIAKAKNPTRARISPLSMNDEFFIYLGSQSARWRTLRILHIESDHRNSAKFRQNIRRIALAMGFGMHYGIRFTYYSTYFTTGHFLAPSTPLTHALREGCQAHVTLLGRRRVGVHMVNRVSGAIVNGSAWSRPFVSLQHKATTAPLKANTIHTTRKNVAQKTHVYTKSHSIFCN